MTLGRGCPEKKVTRAPRFLILLGASAQIHVNFVGEIFLSEILLFAIWVFGNKHLRIESESTFQNPKLATFQKLLVFALVSQLITDVLRSANFLDTIKGSSLILFTLFNLITVSKLNNRYYGVVEHLLLGYALSYFVSAFLQPNEYYSSYPWKFGFAYGATLLLFIILQKYIVDKKVLTAFIIFIFASVNLALDTRSLGFIIFIAAVIHFAGQSAKKSKATALVVLVIALILSASVYTSYISKVSDGSLGLAAQEKYLSQSQNTKNIFFGGRTDVLVGLTQVVKNPIIGMGSYAKISESNRQEIIEEIVGINPNLYTLQSNYREGKLIPIHSILFQFWVWYGILGALPWIWCLFIIAGTLKKDFLSGKGITLLNSYLITLTTWDLLFSPFGADRRFAVPLFLIAILTNRPEVKKVFNS